MNLIRPLELLLTDKWLALVLRYCRGGTLEQYCRGRQVSEDFACYLLHQLVDVVEHLHRHNVAYRDLKLENVLLDRPVGLFGRQAPPRLVLAGEYGLQGGSHARWWGGKVWGHARAGRSVLWLASGAVWQACSTAAGVGR